MPVCFTFYSLDQDVSGGFVGAATVAIDALMECSPNSLRRLTALLIACLALSRAFS